MKRAVALLLAAWAIPMATVHAAESVPAKEAVPLPFAELWKQIDQHSPAQRGAALETQAARASESRMSNYRLPQVYLRGQYVNTDDPASAFMSKLRQRKIEATDFVPSDLNTPGSSTFGEAALGATLPLYEGGFGAARTSAAADTARASEHQHAAIRVQQYAEAFQGYGALLAFQGATQDVDALAGEVEGTISRYEVGSASNPVGYAGLLGMKSLALRLKMMTNDFRAQHQTTQATLSSLAEMSSDRWTPESTSVESYLRANAPQAGNTSAPGAAGKEPESFPARSLRAMAAAVQQEAEIQRSVLKPQMGLFLEGSALSGDRGTGNAYVAGAYVRWNLFAPTQSGASQEAILRSQALQERANAVVTEDQIAIAESLKTEEALRARLALLKQSRDLLDEQLRTSKRMFANGTINALQLTETYSKRVELTQTVLQSELALLQARRNLLLHRPESPNGK